MHSTTCGTPKQRGITQRPVIQFEHDTVSEQRAQAVLDRFAWVDQRVITARVLARGMTVEMEHTAQWNELLSVISGDIDGATARIALAHLAETPLYYERLERMERDAANDPRPSIFYVDATDSETTLHS